MQYHVLLADMWQSTRIYCLPTGDSGALSEKSRVYSVRRTPDKTSDTSTAFKRHILLSHIETSTAGNMEN